MFCNSMHNFTDSPFYLYFSFKKAYVCVYPMHHHCFFYKKIFRFNFFFDLMIQITISTILVNFKTNKDNLLRTVCFWELTSMNNVNHQKSTSLAYSSVMFICNIKRKGRRQHTGNTDAECWLMNKEDDLKRLLFKRSVYCIFVIFQLIILFLSL